MLRILITGANRGIGLALTQQYLQRGERVFATCRQPAEAAELAEHFQWLTQKESYEIAESKRTAIEDEIGDVLIYLVNLADRCGIDPLKAAHDKIEKNRVKYPAEKVRGRHAKY